MSKTAYLRAVEEIATDAVGRVATGLLAVIGIVAAAEKVLVLAGVITKFVVRPIVHRVASLMYNLILAVVF